MERGKQGRVEAHESHFDYILFLERLYIRNSSLVLSTYLPE